ncbi:MAG TPA: Asp-tRNA(Asn)/Glu-tRNA(Gln) amidotransferase subunit GatC [Candidatus Doudnabacteria bacterium]|nr:Asp-tRNA(Asn)/Glu-tRNA(Gln) amidotransferase subunit GatC [Candidatus Doudnabacteria bacterium]
MLTPEEIKKIAVLSRIELRDGEVEKYQAELSSILDYVDELKAVETEGLEIVASVTGLENIHREDKPELIEYQEDILANAPERKDRYYKVKSIL